MRVRGNITCPTVFPNRFPGLSAHFFVRWSTASEEKLGGASKQPKRLNERTRNVWELSSAVCVQRSSPASSVVRVHQSLCPAQVVSSAGCVQPAQFVSSAGCVRPSAAWTLSASYLGMGRSDARCRVRRTP